jgi:hypothetical protein
VGPGVDIATEVLEKLNVSESNRMRDREEDLRFLG